MSARDMFSVYLHSLDATEIELRVLEDGRRWLDITRDVSLVVRPDDDSLDATIAGLRKLAEVLGEMAESFEKPGGAL